jgi:hypothetical protein
LMIINRILEYLAHNRASILGNFSLESSLQTLLILVDGSLLKFDEKLAILR